ncbi:MAG: hypothetical protein SGPRY_012633, partial [Prymnesium sp.]
MREQPVLGDEEDVAFMIKALRSRARGQLNDPGGIGALLRETLPRALLAPCDRQMRAYFTNPDEAWDVWRLHALRLLVDAWKSANGGETREIPTWLESLQASSVLAERLDQITAFLEAISGRTLDGQPQSDIDIDTIFRIEKQDRSYVPKDRSWFKHR